MKNIKVEKITKNWELVQKFAMKDETIEKIEKQINRKRAERLGYTYANKQLCKYKPRLEDYTRDDWDYLM